MADIFAATVTSVNIVYTVVDGWRSYSKEVPDLLITLKYYLDNLQRVQAYFDNLVHPNEGLPHDAKAELEAMNSYLSGLSARCLRLRTKLESNNWRVYFRKLAWNLQQREVERLVGVLKDWAQEFDIHWVSLPDAVRYSYNLKGEPRPNSIQSPVEYIRNHIHSVLQCKQLLPVPEIKPSDIEFIKETAVNPDQTLFHALRLGQRQLATYNDRKAVVEYHTYSQAHRSDVEQLAQVLQSIKPLSMGVLKCQGYYFDQTKGWAMLYDIPRHLDFSKIYTLKGLLIDAQRTGVITHGLNERFRIAKTLAMALFYLHAGGWVHKSVRSNNVIMLVEKDANGHKINPYTLGDAFLAGFEYVRGDTMSSTPAVGTEGADDNDILYQHPAATDRRYSMRFDVYSLGVVLLELGLWKPLQIQHPQAADRHGRILKEAKKLRLAVGVRYQRVVERCLAVEDETTFTKERYVEDILNDLGELSDTMNHFK